MNSRTRTDVLLIAGFCGFLFFYGLGQFGLIGADEPRYAQVAREMLARHDWITPVLWGKPWLEKPPLYYWQAMIAYSIFGVSDWTARVPSAFNATILVVVVYLFFRRFRRGVEVDAALILASSAGIIGYSRAASTDMALSTTFGIAMLAWWAWREDGSRLYLALFYVSLALGTLAKGPIAPFLAALIIAAQSGSLGEWNWMRKTVWLPGIVLFCFLALPWYIAVQLRNPNFLREFILQHNLERFSSNLYHHAEPFWYFFPVTLLALVPWLVFVIAAIAETLRVWWRERRAHALDLELQFSHFTVIWLVLPVLFFSISQSKLPGYILPAVPAGAVLLAEYLRQHGEGSARVSKVVAILHSVIASGIVIPSLLIVYLVRQHRMPTGEPIFIAVAVTFVLTAAIVLTLASRLGLRMLRFVTLIPVVLSVAAVLRWGGTALDQTLSARPVAREIFGMETKPLPLAVDGVSRELEYGLTFYRNSLTIRYEYSPVPAGEHLVVVPEGWQSELRQKLGSRRISFLGHYAPQHVDYFWVSAEK
ncbi:MAG TPA: glycosyltransferase family 39 protein [Candidatus Sulfotelmatobacter sp.]|nr:glycosyltransferase family 39 protein [Candidatus Sulfotelmatobacter sp.]